MKKNTTVGLELKLYKHYNIFLETKFINNLFINFGIEFYW